MIFRVLGGFFHRSKFDEKFPCNWCGKVEVSEAYRNMYCRNQLYRDYSYEFCFDGNNFLLDIMKIFTSQKSYEQLFSWTGILVCQDELDSCLE